jgi:hypothetical protein
MESITLIVTAPTQRQFQAASVMLKRSKSEVVMPCKVRSWLILLRISG